MHVYIFICSIFTRNTNNIILQLINRSNMTLTAHPDKDELIMFGGEYYTGHKVINI